MLAVIQLDIDGGVEVLTSPEGRPIVKIPSAVFVLLDLYNEGRIGMTWEGDADRTAEMLLWRLEDHDLMPQEMAAYHSEMRQLCCPGGPTGNPFTLELVTAA